VVGKGDGEGERFAVMGAPEYEDLGLKCSNDLHEWTSSCDELAKHRQIGELLFKKVNTEPQPFTIAATKTVQSVSYELRCFDSVLLLTT
jgi:hypothetical protein